jgi:RHS repeat-associated protein
MSPQMKESDRERKLSELLIVTDARGNTTTHTYNGMNQLEARTDPLNRTESFSYDLNGNLKTVTDRKGQTTTHTYDAQDRRIRTDYADGSSVTFTYDPAGNLLTAVDSLTGTITRSYDPLNRLAEEVTPQGAISYAYDQVGRRQTTQVNGLQPVVYGYDGNSRLTQIIQGPQTATLAYDAANRRTTLLLPNGVSVEYQYDLASRLVAQIYRSASGVLGDLWFTYDANENRTATGGTWARTEIPTGVPTSSYDAANEQVAFGEVTQTFDANGNLLTQTEGSGTTTYTWDVRNRLVAINGPAVNAAFSYDAFGRRLTKIINAATTAFQYDGADIVRENGPMGEAAYLRTPTIDETLARTDANAAVIYLADILRSTVALADSSGGPVTEYTYAPFGQTSVAGLPSPNLFQFTGRENDGTGLYYYRARYYEPRKSRFLQADPLGIRDGRISLYAYAENNPVNAIDPMGLLATYGGWEGQFIFGYGQTTVTCCDGEYERRLKYRKVCFGAGFTVGMSGGVASGSEGTSCKTPPTYLFAPEFGTPIIGVFGAEAGAGFSHQGGGAFVGGTIGVGGKATVCYYWLVSNTVRGCCK